MSHRCTIVAALLLAACAPTAQVGTTEITSANELTSYRESDQAANDLAKKRWEEALARAEHAEKLSPENPYAHYDRAVALRELGRTDASVAEFREAEQRFTGDREGRAISIYGRARALDDAGRCGSAKGAYDEFASFTSSFDPAASKMATSYAEQCRPKEPVIGDAAMTDLDTDVITHDWTNALLASERVGKTARGSGWVDYNRGIALAGLGRTDEAVAAYHAAEERFGTEPKNRAVAIYGRARALDQAGRCGEAKRAYAEYANLVRAWSPSDAKMAETVARGCGP